MSVYCGREFGLDDIQTINKLMEQNPSLQRAPMSRQLCQLWGWNKPNGELKDMTCRVALLRMQADGLITLPPSRMTGGARSKPHFPPTQATDPQPPLLQPVHELPVLSMHPVKAAAASRLWNEFIARYHYLGYTSMSGAQMRYNVYAGERLVALLSFGARCLEARRTRQFYRLAAGPTTEEPATRRQQRPLPDPALDPVQGPGFQDPVAHRAPIARRLVSAIRL